MTEQVRGVTLVWFALGAADRFLRASDERPEFRPGIAGEAFEPPSGPRLETLFQTLPPDVTGFGTANHYDDTAMTLTHALNR